MDASNAKIQYESGQDLVAFVALTDQGDHKDFRSADPLWSNRAGFEPDIKPNGLATGGAITPAISGSNDVVDVGGLTAYLAGVLTTVVADADLAIARPTASHVKYSITVLANGSLSAVKGSESTSFSTTRGAAGGPPYILPTSIEIGQVWLSSATPAAILATEIKQVVGTHTERYDYPTWEEKRFNVSNGIIGNAGIIMASVLPLIHTVASPVTPAAKPVYAQYYEPEFTDVPKSSDFVPPETTHAVSSTQIYGGTIGSSSSSLNQGGFTAFLQNGISDGILALKNLNLFFKFFQNKLSVTPYMLMQGKLGIARTFPAGNQITAACTISAEEAAAEVTG